MTVRQLRKLAKSFELEMPASRAAIVLGIDCHRPERFKAGHPPLPDRECESHSRV